MTVKTTILDKYCLEVLEKVPLDFAHYQKNLVDWCNHNTGSRNYSSVASFLPRLENAFAQLGGEIKHLPLEKERVVLANGEIKEIDLGHSLHVKMRPNAPIQLVLTGHYDTVFGADSHFQNVTDLGDENIYGPGVADMKGGILVMLEGLKAFENHPDKNNIGYEVLLSPDEEIGSLGSAHILYEIGKKSDLGLTFEPALPDGSMAGARKGSANFALIIHGVSAHVGRAHHEGKSAIKAAAQFVCEIEDINGKYDGITINTGKIDGGSANNVVPDLAIVRFNIRAPSQEKMEFAIDKVKSAIKNLDGFHCHLEGGISRPPKPRNNAQERIFTDIGNVARDLGMELQFKDTGGVCEGNNLFASGCPNIDTLGVCGGLIHSPQEFAIKKSFGERARLLAAILCSYANGTIDAKAPRKLMGENKC